MDNVTISLEKYVKLVKENKELKDKIWGFERDRILIKQAYFDKIGINTFLQYEFSGSEEALKILKEQINDPKTLSVHK